MTHLCLEFVVCHILFNDKQLLTISIISIIAWLIGIIWNAIPASSEVKITFVKSRKTKALFKTRYYVY